MVQCNPKGREPRKRKVDKGIEKCRSEGSGSERAGNHYGVWGKTKDLGNYSKGKEWYDWSHWEEPEKTLKGVESK